MKKKLLIIVLVLLMLITSFFVLTKKPKIKYKKLKELNYNVTYKQAFPDENLRRSVVLCIMRNKCNSLNGNNNFKDVYDFYDNSNYLTDTRLGPVITEEQIKTKEEEQISKQELDKLDILVPNNAKKEIVSLQGIEYLLNIKNIIIPDVQVEHVDLSSNIELKSLRMYAYKAKSINLNQNSKLENIEVKLSENEKNLDLSHLTKLKSLKIGYSGLKDVKLPNGVTYVNLTKNKITDINIPTTVKELYLVKNKLTSIILPSNMEVANLSENILENVTLTGPVKDLNLEINKISNIDLAEGIKIVNLSKNKITDINIPTTVKFADLDYNRITHIELPNDIETAYLSDNKISNIDLTNNVNIKFLILSENPLEDIDVSKNINLEYLKFSLKNSKDTINFSNNPKLSVVEIQKIGEGKIKSLDFSNNPNLTELRLENIALTNLNIDNNNKLTDIYLSGNNLESINLYNKTELKYVDLLNNKTSKVKIPNNVKERYQFSEGKWLKTKKNSYIKLPNMFYNDKEYFLDENPNYEKFGDKYVFKNTGIFEIKSTVLYNPNNYRNKVYWTYIFEVESGEEDTFNPSIDQGNYTPLINEEIPVNNLKEMITNLPANIKNFEVLSPNTFTDKGDKTIKVRITFSDDTFKEVDVPIKVYEKEDILPTVTVTPETLEVIDKKAVNINITRSYAKEDNIDNTNFIKTVRDNLVSYEYLNKANGLTYNSNSVTGVIDYLFTGTEEEHTFNITYKEQGKIYTFNKNISIKLLRDTDKDGIADKDDDDKDGDGFSNAVEIARGSDPYDKTSLPDMSKKDELDNLVKQLEKLIEDTKNNPFDTKNKLDVDNLKNNYLPLKVIEKDNIKGSYSATTSDTELVKLIEKTKKEIDDIKKEINKLRDKANFDELDKEITKEIKDIYTKDSLNPLKEKLEEAKNLNRDTAIQEEVDKLTKEIKELRDKLIIDNNKKQEEEKNINNPNTGIKTYSLIILFIIFISYLIFKKKKSYIR